MSKKYLSRIFDDLKIKTFTLIEMLVFVGVSKKFYKVQRATIKL